MNTQEEQEIDKPIHDEEKAFINQCHCDECYYDLVPEARPQPIDPIKIKSLKDNLSNIFKPVVYLDKDFIGNFKMKYSKKIKDWFDKYFDRYIISIESKGTADEHCHFWASKPTLRANKTSLTTTRNTLANYIRRDFPELKRNGRGGQNKYNFKVIKETFQFLYIFKENNIESYKNVSLPEDQIQLYIEEYNRKKHLINAGASGHFYLYVLDNNPRKDAGSRLKNRAFLVGQYIEYCKLRHIAATLTMCERAINMVLQYEDTANLTKQFKDILEYKYNRQYFI